MLGTTHTTVNTAAWWTAVGACQLATGHILLAPLTIGTGLVVAVSRLPDIDHPTSGPGYRVNRILPGFPTMLAKVFGHRKSPMHWGGTALVSGIVAGAISYHIAASWWWIGVALGGSWLLHIGGDCLTWQGAPLFAPLSTRMIRPRYGRRFRCGGYTERHWIMPAAIVWCVLSASLITVTVMRVFSGSLPV